MSFETHTSREVVHYYITDHDYVTTVREKYFLLILSLHIYFFASSITPFNLRVNTFYYTFIHSENNPTTIWAWEESTPKKNFRIRIAVLYPKLPLFFAFYGLNE